MAVRKLRPRRFLAAAAAAVGLTALVACSTETTAIPTPAPSTAPAGRTQGSAMPTVVLVHGAFEGPSAWQPVIEKLQAAHYPVIAPLVPLKGPSADTATLRETVAAIDGPKILVGHSYAGLLISQLAHDVPNVSALVYVAAFIPRAGESAGQLNSEFPGSKLGPSTTHTVDLPDGTALLVNQDAFADLFDGGADTPQVKLAASAQRPILAAAFDEKLTVAAPPGIRTFAMVATQDQAIPPQAERAEAARAHADVVEVDSPHAIATTDPDAIVNLIQKAAG